MKYLLWLAALAPLSLLGSSPPSPAQSAVTQRIPNSDPESFYPRWLGWTHPIVEYDPFTYKWTYGPYTGTALDVDSAGVVHMLVTHGDSPNLWKLSYLTNDAASREPTGFGPANRSLAIYNQPILGHDARIDANGVLHVVWSASLDGRFGLIYSRKTAQGWTPLVNMTVSAPSSHFFTQPKIALAPNGVVHVVAHRQYTPPEVSRNDIAHIAWNGTTAQITSIPGSMEEGATLPPGANNVWYISTSLSPKIAVNRQGTVIASWTRVLQLYTDQQPPPAVTIKQAQVYSTKTATGSWSATPAVLYSADYWFLDYDLASVYVDPEDGVHFTYSILPPSNANQSLRGLWYVKLGESPRLMANQPGTVYYQGGVTWDSLRNLHVVWLANGALFHSVRLRNLSTGVLDSTWRSQTPAVPAHPVRKDPSVQRVVASRNDQIHVCGKELYTCTSNFGLGVRDPAALIPGLPGGQVNAANGNLMYSLPLFQARGVGPTNSLSLVHNTQDPFFGHLGQGWRFNFEAYVIDHNLGYNDNVGTLPTDPNDRATVVFADGRAVEFKWRSYTDVGGVSRSAFLPDPEYGFFGRLERIFRGLRILPEWKLTTSSGTVLWFDGRGKFQKLIEPTGNYLQVGYNSVGVAVQVVDMLGNGGGGRQTTIAYETTPAPGLPSVRPVTITDPKGKRIQLGYTGQHLSSVAFIDAPSVPTHRFETATADNLTAGERINQLKRVLSPRGAAWTLRSLPDGRLSRIEDPPAPYLLDSDGDAVAAVSRVATMAFTYNDGVALGSPLQTDVLDRRGFPSRYTLDPRKGLVEEFRDPSVMASTPNVFAIVRTFDADGNLTNFKDRWGKNTSYTYSVGVPDYVRNNLNEVRRPGASGGPELVSSRTYTTDGFNQVATATSYATPAEGSAPAARVTTFEYNSVGQLTTVRPPNVTRPDGVAQTASATYTYNGPRRTLSVFTNEEGNTVTYSDFEPTHNLPQRVLKSGGTQTDNRAFDILGNVLWHQAPIGSASNDFPGATQFAMDGMHRTTTVTDPTGKIWTYGYDVDSNLISVLPPVGGQTTYTYDVRGNASGGTSPDGSWAQWVNADGQVRRNRNLRGFDTNVTIDFLGRVTATRAPGGTTVTGGGGGPALHTTQLAYDQFDGTDYSETTTEVSASGNRVTKTLLDARGRPKATILPDGVTRFETIFDEQDQVVAEQVKKSGALQTCSVAFRDPRDRVFRQSQQDAPYGTAPLRQENTYLLYNKAGSLVQIVDPLGNVAAAGNAHKTTYVRDARQRVQRVLDGQGQAVAEYVYGDDDRLSEVRRPDPETKGTQLVTQAKFSYTGRKEIKAALDAFDKGESYTYGSLPGQRLTATDALGRIRRWTYHTTTQRVNEVIEGSGTAGESKSLYTWANGLLSEIKVWDPTPGASGYTSSHKYFYDKADRLEKVVAPLVADERTFYNEFGEPRQFIAGTKTITHTYNTLGLPTRSAWTNAYAKTIDRTFNGLGQVESVSDGSLTRGFTYDLWRGLPLDEMFKVGTSTWKIQTHTHDAAGNYLELLDGENAAHRYGYDPSNRLTKVSFKGTDVVRIAYTPGGLVDTETRLNASGTPIAVTTHYYDRAARRVRSVTTRSATAEVISDHGFTYDPAGQLQKVTQNQLGSNTSMTFDERGQVKSETAAGNGGGLTPPPFTNQIGGPGTGPESLPSSEPRGIAQAVMPVPARTVSYTYHPSGTRATMSVGGVQTLYEYNAAGQLTKETTGSSVKTSTYDTWGNLKTRGTETFGYNYLGRMSSYTNSATGANWQYDFYPTGERYAKVNLSTSQSQLYVPRFHDVATEYTRTGTGAPALANTYVQGLGIDSKSTRVPVTGGRRHYIGNQVGTVESVLDDAAGVAERVLRDAWGQPLAGTSAERYGFAQREHDTESGLVYMRHRMYDPKLGRFTQTDPIRGNRPFEHYSYAGNSPINRIDPMGDRWKVTPGRGTDSVLTDLQKYTGRQISIDSSGHAWFSGKTWGDQYASRADMDWIWRVQDDASATDIEILWRHVTNGDQWHRDRFKEAWLAYSGLETAGQAFDRGSAAGWEGFKEGATFGYYEAPDWARKTEGFNISRGIGMATTSIELALAGGGAAVGFGAPVSGVTAFNATTIMGVQGGIPMGLAEAGGALALYGASVYDSKDAPDPAAAARTAGTVLLNGMVQHPQAPGPRGSKPPNMSPPGAGRTGALHAALRANGVPTSQTPTRVLPNIDRRGNIVPGRVYEYDVPAPGGGTRTVRIRDDSAGHEFRAGDPQNRGPHFNDEAGNHYDY